MNKLLLLLVVIGCFFTNQTKAQLTAHAGVDFSYCDNENAGAWIGFSVATGGVPPYTYAWSPASAVSDSTLEHPMPTATVTTTLTVVVTDSTGATASDTIVITVLPAPVVSMFISDSVICNLTTLVGFTASVVGNPATYLWETGDGTQYAGSVAQHTYTTAAMYSPTLTVTDSNGCSAAISQNIHVGQMPGVFINSVNVTCFGSNDGFAQAVVNGGGNYFYNWSTGQNTMVMQGIPAGVYFVTVFDGNGCSASASTVITQPVPINVSATAVNISATGLCDGSVFITANGGNPPYVYNWAGGITTQNLIGACMGNYTVTVTDMNGCTATATATVAGSCPNNTLVLAITSHGLSCAHPLDTLRAVVSGGNPPYSFFWNTVPSSALPYQITANGGVYGVIVTDSLGCQKSAQDTLVSTGVVISLLSNTPSSCNGSANGNVIVGVTGGTSPYTYSWSNASTSDSLLNVIPGYYSVTVTDNAGCSSSAGFNVGQGATNWSYYVYANATNGNCGNNGSATVSVYGGTSPFTYLWSNGDTTATTGNLTPGNYMVTVTGSDGCTRNGYTYVSTNCFNVVQGHVFNDTNGNCIWDNGETAQVGLYVMLQNGTYTFYGYTDNNGLYTVNVPYQGNFTVQVSNGAYGNCSSISTCAPQNANFTGLGDTATANFGIQPGSAYNLALHPGWTSANPGFQKDYWVLYQQLSTPLYVGPAVITFTYDSILQYISCTNGGIHNSINHTITWNLSSVPTQWVSWTSRPMASFTVPANTPVGYQLRQEFLITPIAGDCDSSDNHLVFIQPVTGSMDPNEKEVSPAGDIQEEDSVLTYTIHFQNTGNDTTWFITVKDTLSSYLNPASVVNLASSHPYSSFNVSDNGILTWLFNPIFLVDSFTNEPASKGFVMFKIKKKPNLPLTTQIRNRAHIYFDYNEPVVTNTVTSTLTDPLSVHNVTNDAAIQVAVAPNPFTQQTQITVEGIAGVYNFELFDVSGKLLQKKNELADNRFTINREGMSAGVYFYSITTSSKQKAFGRLVVE